MSIVLGHWQSRLLHTAVESELFTAVAEGPANAEELSERLGLTLPGAKDFFLALAGVGLLESRDGRFHNSPSADRYLVRGRPEYLGGYLTFVREELNPAWDGLTSSVRTGLPHNKAAHGGNPYTSLYRDQESIDSFLASMDLLNSSAATQLAALDWSRYSSFVDVGGARGSVAHEVVSKYPHLHGTVFDLPQLETAFGEHVAELGESTLDFVGGDFFVDPLPRADVVVFGHVLHNWDTERRRHLLRSAYDAVNPGGAVVVYDPMVTEGEGAPPFSAVLASLSMLVWSSGGGEYAAEDLVSWLREAGFRPDPVDTTISGEDVVVVAHKD
jgi:8-O-methyltransferase